VHVAERRRREVFKDLLACVLRTVGAEAAADAPRLVAGRTKNGRGASRNRTRSSPRTTCAWLTRSAPGTGSERERAQRAHGARLGRPARRGDDRDWHENREMERLFAELATFGRG